MAFWFASFLPVYPDLIKTWINDSDNAHGMFVPLVSLFFIWRKRGELQAANVSDTNWGWAVLAGCLRLYLLGYTGGIAVIQRLMIVCSLIGLVWFTLGKIILLLLVFPLFFLFFMVPVPAAFLGLASLPLQLFANKRTLFRH